MDAKSYILLLNREKRYVQSVCEALVKAGYDVLMETTMQGALNVLDRHRPAIIVCDCELEDANGYDFLARVKKNPASKSVPFVFLVSSHVIVDSLEEEVAKILKAFDMGAVDFIVDTMDEDIVGLLMKRIRKVLPANTLPNASPAEMKTEEGSATSESERRESQRIVPGQVAVVELSRDGVLWMPGRITNINDQGLMIETSLLGRLGMLLYIRVGLSGGKSIVATSHIKHIAIKKESSSAEIGVELDESVEWIKLYNYVAKLMGLAKKPSDTAEMPPEKTGVQIAGDKKQYIYVDPHLDRVEETESGRSLEIKFYRSLIGKQLGNYKVMSFIGAGSMAGVFKGWDVLLERNVALKVISYKLSTIPSYRDMFIREARVVSKLTHPNIAQIYHIDQRDDLFYFVMELISGGTLVEFIKDRSKLNVAKTLEYLITVCRTLDFVTKQNIVHRDIKPANIMIDERGVLKVVDFGVAVVIDETTKHQKIEGFGSPLYASPECILGQSLDICSDIYSLGATFYHVLAGVPPFDGDTVEDVIKKHLNEYMVPLKKRNPMVSVDLSDIIDKMMAKKPNERYTSYRALLGDLTEVVH
jgi:CheY-like chemotaxis protein/predicted Ser/Thr protein kinase